MKKQKILGTIKNIRIKCLGLGSCHDLPRSTRQVVKSTWHSFFYIYKKRRAQGARSEKQRAQGLE